MPNKNREQQAAKYKKFMEKVQHIDYSFRLNERDYWLVVYVKNNDAKGYLVICEQEGTQQEKMVAFRQFITFLTSINATDDEIRKRTKINMDFVKEMENWLKEWATEAVEIDRVKIFSNFADFIIQSQKIVNEQYNELIKEHTQIAERGYFTESDVTRIVNICSDLNLLLFLQLKRQYENYQYNQELMKNIKKNSHGLKTSHQKLLLAYLDEFCNQNALFELERSLDTYGETGKTAKGNLNSLVTCHDEFLTLFNAGNDKRWAELSPLIRN